MMNTPRLSRLPRLLPGLLAALSLTACAPLPELGPGAEARDPATLQSTQSLKAPEAAWPSEHWWAKYHDPQLEQLIAEGLAGAPDLKIAEARLKRAEAAAQAAGAPLYPQITGNAQVYGQQSSTNYIAPKPYTPDGWYSYGQATINFNWEIDFWGKNRAALAAAVSDSQARRAELAQARLILTTSIAQRYAELARLMADRKTAQATLGVRTKTYALFAERQRQGLENLGAVTQAAGRKYLAENDLVQLDVQIAQMRNQLAALVGAGPDRGLSINPPPALIAADYALPADIGINLIGRRPDIVAARWQVEAGKSRITQQEAMFYPNLSLSAFIGAQSLGIDRLFQSGSGISNAGPALYLPIFMGGKLRADLNAAHAAHDENVANYEKTLIQALQEVADAAAAQQRLQQEITLVDKSVAAQNRAFQVASDRYRGGLSNYLNVLSAEDELLNSWRVQTEIRSRAFIQDVALIKALGGGYQNDADEDRRNIKKTQEFPK